MGKRTFIPSYNVFVDDFLGWQMLALNFDNVYDASAVAHFLFDETVRHWVYTDLHTLVIPDAMLRPEVVEKMRDSFRIVGVLL